MSDRLVTVLSFAAGVGIMACALAGMAWGRWVRSG